MEKLNISRHMKTHIDELGNRPTSSLTVREELCLSYVRKYPPKILRELNPNGGFSDEFNLRAEYDRQKKYAEAMNTFVDLQLSKMAEAEVLRAVAAEDKAKAETEANHAKAWTEWAEKARGGKSIPPMP